MTICSLLAQSQLLDLASRKGGKEKITAFIDGPHGAPPNPARFGAYLVAGVFLRRLPINQELCSKAALEFLIPFHFFVTAPGTPASPVCVELAGELYPSNRGHIRDCAWLHLFRSLSRISASFIMTLGTSPKSPTNRGWDRPT